MDKFMLKNFSSSFTYTHVVLFSFVFCCCLKLKQTEQVEFSNRANQKNLLALFSLLMEKQRKTFE